MGTKGSHHLLRFANANSAWQLGTNGMSAMALFHFGLPHLKRGPPNVGIRVEESGERINEMIRDTENKMN